MEPNNFSNLNTPNFPTPHKHSFLKIFSLIIFIILIVGGTLYLKKIYDRNKDAEYLKMIREKSLEALVSDENNGIIDEVASEQALKDLVSDIDDSKKELTPEEKKELEEFRKKALESL